MLLLFKKKNTCIYLDSLQTWYIRNKGVSTSKRDLIEIFSLNPPKIVHFTRYLGNLFSLYIYISIKENSSSFTRLSPVTRRKYSLRLIIGNNELAILSNARSQKFQKQPLDKRFLFSHSILSSRTRRKSKVQLLSNPIFRFLPSRNNKRTFRGKFAGISFEADSN